MKEKRNKMRTTKCIVRMKVNFGYILYLAESCRFDSGSRWKKCGSKCMTQAHCKEIGCCYVLQKHNSSTWSYVEASKK